MSNDTTDQHTDGIDAGTIDTGGITPEYRSFLEDAIVAAGGVITDSGYGCGGADLGYTYNGVQFSVNVKVRHAAAA